MTEAIEHSCTLMERHRVVIDHDTLAGLNSGEIVTTCKREAERWAERHGLDIGTVSVVQWSGGLGVEFDVVIGKGRIDLDQRVPGALDTWTWSGRFQWWRRVLTNADGREGRVLAAREDAYREYRSRANARPMFGVMGGGGGARLGTAYPEGGIQGEVPSLPPEAFRITRAEGEVPRVINARHEDELLMDEIVAETRAMRRERCGECYQLGGAHAVDCTRVTGQ